MTFRLGDLAIPIIAAPMAGGPGTVALAAAVSDAGGLGFLAGGYLSPQRLADDIDAVRAASSGPIGVNLFVPQPSVGRAAALDRFADQLAPLAQRYGVAVGRRRTGDDDGWQDKLEVVAGARPEAVSFTFGTPSREVLGRFARHHIFTLVTVTSVAEAELAVAAGADGLVVQGPGAGGHRGTFAPGAEPGDEALEELLGRVAAAHEVPLVAAGGLGAAADVAAVLGRGARAAQVGTALLLSDEAGTNAVHRAALQNAQTAGTTGTGSPGRTVRPAKTVVTRAFSGRYARSLVNDFTDRFDRVAPPGYPEVNQMTSPIRKAAVGVGDPNGTSLWAGIAHGAIRGGRAADIVASLAG